MREELRNKDKLTSEMGDNPNASIMNILTKTSEMGENPLESKMNNVSPLKNVKMNSKKMQMKKSKSIQTLTPLQQQWKEIMERQLGKPIGFRVYNPYLKEYVYPVHNEESIKSLIKMIPSDAVIRQYIQKVQNDKKNQNL